MIISRTYETTAFQMDSIHNILNFLKKADSFHIWIYSNLTFIFCVLAILLGTGTVKVLFLWYILQD